MRMIALSYSSFFNFNPSYGPRRTSSPVHNNLLCSLNGDYDAGRDQQGCSPQHSLHYCLPLQHSLSYNLSLHLNLHLRLQNLFYWLYLFSHATMLVTDDHIALHGGGLGGIFEILPSVDLDELGIGRANDSK